MLHLLRHLVLLACLALTLTHGRIYRAVAGAMAGVGGGSQPSTDDDKTMTVVMQGKSQTLTLLTYDEVDTPFRTYYANSMVADSNCSAIACSVFFLPKTVDATLNDARVQIFFPQDLQTIVDLDLQSRHPDGYIAASGWSITGESIAADQLPYAWMKKAIAFTSPQQSVMGRVYLGEAAGRIFRVTVQYPISAQDRFPAMAQPILSHLQVAAVSAKPTRSTAEFSVCRSNTASAYGLQQSATTQQSLKQAAGYFQQGTDFTCHRYQRSPEGNLVRGALLGTGKGTGPENVLDLGIIGLTEEEAIAKVTETRSFAFTEIVRTPLPGREAKITFSGGLLNHELYLDTHGYVSQVLQATAVP